MDRAAVQVWAPFPALPSVGLHNFSLVLFAFQENVAEFPPRVRYDDFLDFLFGFGF